MENLFKKWMDGEVNWSEEKQLRQKAQNDPFLADAMEGYDAFPESDHKVTIERLKKGLPTGKKKKEHVFTLYRVAAAAAVVGIVATLFLIQTELEQPTVLTETTKMNRVEEAKDFSAPTSEAPMVTLEPQKSQSVSPTNEGQTITKENDIDKKENKADNPPIPKNKPIAAKTKSSERKTQNPAPIIIEKEETQVAQSEKRDQVIEATPPPVLAIEKPIIEEPDLEETIVLADEVEADIPAATNARSAPASPKSRPESDIIKAKKSRSAVSFIQGEPQSRTYIGTVKNQDGQPLEEVTIQGLDSDYQTISKIEGAFKLVVDSPIEYIIISKPGFHTRRISINQYSDFLNVVLTQKARNSNDFYAKEELPSASKMTPRPKGGFLKFERYVDKNLTYPQEANEQGIERDIEVRFYVNEDGQPTQFETQGNDDYGFEKEAIRLIQEGPKWKPANRNVVVIISFKL